MATTYENQLLSGDSLVDDALSHRDCAIGGGLAVTVRTAQ